MGDGVTLVSSAEECAKDVYRMLAEHRARARERRAAVLVRDHGLSPEEFETIGRRFLGPELASC